jgi:hypothetical protein
MAPLLQGPDAFHEIAAELLAAAAVELDNSPGGRPGRVCVVPGAIAWDDCECAGGQLAVAVLRLYRTAQFPLDLGGGPGTTGSSAPCDAALLAAELLVQVIRCAPLPDEQGTPPTCEALDRSARQVHADAWHVRLGVGCRLRDLHDADQIMDYTLGTQPIVGPEGGCVGSQLAVIVAIPDACGCEEAAP